MVATRYRSGNKYLRELQLHPAVEYLLQCFVVPSSVVLVWNQVSLAMREEGELKEIEKSGCDMDGPMGMARFDLNSIDIEWSGESTGQLVPLFSHGTSPEERILGDHESRFIRGSVRGGSEPMFRQESPHT